MGRSTIFFISLQKNWCCLNIPMPVRSNRPILLRETIIYFGTPINCLHINLPNNKFQFIRDRPFALQLLHTVSLGGLQTGWMRCCNFQSESFLIETLKNFLKLLYDAQNYLNVDLLLSIVIVYWRIIMFLIAIWIMTTLCIYRKS